MSFVFKMTFAGDASRRVMYYSPFPTGRKPLANKANGYYYGYIVLSKREVAMNQKTLFKVSTVGYSKGCSKSLSLLRFCVEREMRKTRFTAHELAKVTGFSVSQMQRCMRQLLKDELVDFISVERKGKPAREWFAK